MLALSFTTILIQIQAAFQGNARNLLPILVAALLALAGAARSFPVRTGFARLATRMPAFRCAVRRAFSFPGNVRTLPGGGGDQTRSFSTCIAFSDVLWLTPKS
jgi:hypothetical protein